MTRKRAEVVLAIVAALSGTRLGWAESGPAPAAQSPRLAQSGSMVLESDAQDAAQRVAEAARALGGQLVRSGPAEVVVDVPNASYAAFSQRLRAIGALSGERLATSDLTDEIAEAEASQRAAIQRRERLERIGSTNSQVSGGITVEQELERALGDRASAEARLRDIDHRASMTRLVVSLVLPELEHVEGAKLPFPWLDELSLPFLLDTSTRSRHPVPVLRGFIDGNVRLDFGWAADHEKLGTRYLGAAAMSSRVLGEANPVGVYGGGDLSLGAGGGFLYGLQLILGAGVPIGSRFALAVGSGPGFDGVTSVVPFGVNLPLELYLSLDVGSSATLTLFARDGWVFNDERKKGSKHAPFGDEMAMGLSLGFGGDESGSSYRRSHMGVVFGVGYRELMGTGVYGLTLGWGAHEDSLSESY